MKRRVGNLFRSLPGACGCVILGSLSGDRFHWLVWHGIFRVIARKAPSANGTEVGPVSALPGEPARLREDAALSLPDVHGTELHRSGGVEDPAVTRVQDG